MFDIEKFKKEFLSINDCHIHTWYVYYMRENVGYINFKNDGPMGYQFFPDNIVLAYKKGIKLNICVDFVGLLRFFYENKLENYDEDSILALWRLKYVL
jgi:hypothetical protein